MTTTHPTPGLLPVIDALPSLRGMSGRFLHRLIQRLHHGRVVVELPNGQRVEHVADRPGPTAALHLHRWRALRRLLTSGDVGFAEAYIDGDWSTPDLTALIELAAINASSLDPAILGSAPVRWLNRVMHRLRSNTRRGSRRNIIAHYDLGNDFYRAWLDAGLSYSSALYTSVDQTLEDAQTAKQDRAIAMLGLHGGETVLEIGFGWGGLAERLVREKDSRFTGLTLSPAQLAHSRAQLVGRRADLRLLDYRDMSGQFDRIVSIEMLEAVGERYWPVYFDKLRQCLAPGGTAVVQVITIAEDRFEAYRGGADFIQRHVFPGGMLPSPSALRMQIQGAGLQLREAETFGTSYARTLKEWHRRFLAAWPEIQAMGFDTRFQRLWRYYLSYCEAGFNTGAIDVGLYRISHADAAA